MIYPFLGGSVPIQDHSYTIEAFLNAIKQNLVMTVGHNQVDTSYHGAWILKRIAMIQTALMGSAQQWPSHLPLENKKKLQAFCREFQKACDKPQSQTQAKLLVESITRASEKKKH